MDIERWLAQSHLVKTGLSNDQYTELIGNKLSAGTSVIVRVSRRQNK